MKIRLVCLFICRTILSDLKILCSCSIAISILNWLYLLSFHAHFINRTGGTKEGDEVKEKPRNKRNLQKPQKKPADLGMYISGNIFKPQCIGWAYFWGKSMNFFVCI